MSVDYGPPGPYLHPMGRPRDGDRSKTPFGQLLDQHRVSYVEAARQLNLTRQYVGDLASRKGPTLTLWYQIEDWLRAKKWKLDVATWRPYLPEWKEVRRKFARRKYDDADDLQVDTFMPGATKLGRACRKLGVSVGQLARDLGVTRSYARMLCAGEATPGLALAIDVEEWSRRLGEPVPVGSWRRTLALLEEKREAKKRDVGDWRE